MSEAVIHIINLEHRADRRENLALQSKIHGFAYRLWPGVTSEPYPFYNINKAFKNIVRWAKSQNLSRVIIGEDDLNFTAPGAWEYYLNNMPTDFDTYLGGIYAGTIEEGRITNGYSGHTLITVHERFYDFFLSANEKDHIDRWLGNYAFEKQYRVCEPFVVFQTGGYSDNHKRTVNYDGYHENFKFFGE